MSLDINELESENSRLQEKGTGGGYLDNFVQFPTDGPGHITLRFLPPAAKGMFGREKNGLFCSTRTHRLNGRSYHCPKEMVDGRWVGECPVCFHYSNLWKKSETQAPEEAKKTQALARSFKPVERYYYNAIVRQQVNKTTGVVEKNVGPKIFSTGQKAHAAIIRAIVPNKETGQKGYGDVTHPLNGRDYIYIKTISKSGEDSFPDYSTSSFATETSPLGTPEEVKKWLEELHDLKSLRLVKSNDELKHELRVHLGLERDTRNGSFDAADFEQPDTAPTVTETKKAVVQPVSVTTAAKTNPPAEEMVESDFLKELNSI